MQHITESQLYVSDTFARLPVEIKSISCEESTGNPVTGSHFTENVIPLNQLFVYQDYIRETFTNNRTTNYVSFWNPHAILGISDEMHTKFWTSYCDNVANGERMFVGERPKDIEPIIYEFNIESGMIIDDDFLEKLYRGLRETILEFYEPSAASKNAELSVVILETDFWNVMCTRTGKTTPKKLIKFHFPYAKIDSSNIDKGFRTRFVSKIINQGISYINRMISAYNGIGNGNVLYGSCSDEHIPMYRIKYIWALNDNGDLQNLELQEIFIPSNHKSIQDGLVPCEIFQSKNLDHWLPLFLSLDYWTKHLEPKGRRSQQPTPTTENSLETSEHMTLSNDLFEKSISGNHQEIANAILMFEWSPLITFCKLMYDVHTHKVYVFDTDKKIWENVVPQHAEYKGRMSYLNHLEIISNILSQEIQESENQSFISKGEVTLKLIRSVTNKYKNNSTINAVWTRMLDTVANRVICKPFHADTVDVDYALQRNIFQGFTAKKVDFDLNDPRLSRLLAHIFVVWANRDENLYKYILSWLAYPLRNLERANVALVLIGDQGCGKSMIFEFLNKYVYGPESSEIVASFEPILQRFNGILSGKMLICVDETSTADHKNFCADFNKFKPKITGDSSQIERKGVEIKTVTNYNSFAICSNHDVPVKIEEKDRRYVVIDCNSEYRGNKEYFNTLVAECFTQDVGNLFYSYIRSDHVSDLMVPLTPVFNTTAKQRIIDYQRPQVLNFFDEIFVTSSYPIPGHIINVSKGRDHPFVSSMALYKVYKDWCRARDCVSTYKEKGFCIALYKYEGISLAGRKMVDGLRVMCAYIEDHLDTCLVLLEHEDTYVTLKDYMKSYM